MATEEIYAKIQEILAEQKGEGIVVKPELSLQDGIADDSVEVMEFVISLEDEFDVEIPDQAIEEFVTLADIVDYIQSEKRS